jgi:enoyl-[acyl-carrier protein] reductase I
LPVLLQGKKALIVGVANERSIAYGIAKAFKDQGADLAFTYVGEAIRKRVDPISEELGGQFTLPLDVTSDEELEAAAKEVKERWGTVDILVHSVAFAHRDDLKGRFVDTSREGYKLALDVSAYSLTALCRVFEPLLSDKASVMTLTYYGGEKVITNYNVMGVAKAALEAGVRYLAADLGPAGVRVNAISAGPIKTLAASGIAGFKDILHQIEEKSPLKRTTTLEDVGGAALFLASDLSAGVTGEVLYVDSGYNIMGI